MEFIMDWTDSFSENFPEADLTQPDTKKAVDNIVQLWIEYANMEAKLRQWKRAVKVFDDALNDSIVSKSGIIYGSYANYYKERSKLSNAQKVYLRGLTSDGLIQPEIDLIWIEYLNTMHQYGSPDLSLEELYQVILKQVETKKLSPPSTDTLEKYSRKAILQKQQQMKEKELLNKSVAVEIKEENKEKESTTDTIIEKNKIKIENININEVKLSQNISTPMNVIEAETDTEDKTLEDLDDIHGLNAEQLIKKFHARPPLLFCAPNMVSYNIFYICMCFCNIYKLYLIYYRNQWYQVLITSQIKKFKI